LAEYKAIKIRGLMTVLPIFSESTQGVKGANCGELMNEHTNICQTGHLNYVRASAKSIQELFLSMRKAHANFDVLSMGMSDDFEIAIEYGANLLRLGSVLF
jgi:uncharacterized pyridoxal phosphate-containing UPF0001 family protein